MPLEKDTQALLRLKSGDTINESPVVTGERGLNKVTTMGYRLTHLDESGRADMVDVDQNRTVSGRVATGQLKCA